MSKNIFITGTGTDIGKTYICALIVKKLKEYGKNAAYFKAAMSGNERSENGGLIPGDALFVKNISGIEQPLSQMCPYVYENAVSPHLASRIEGSPVSLERVKERFSDICQSYEYVTMEGSGGIVCPIRFDDRKIMLTDIIRELGLSCVIAADAGLGTINNVVLTYRYMHSEGIPVKGLIFNRLHTDRSTPHDRLIIDMQNDNIKMCEQLTALDVIARVGENAGDMDIDPEALISLYE